MTDTQPRGLRSLLALEDWWAVWLGGLLIAGVATGLITDVPGVGRWTASIGDAFGAGPLAGLLVLGVALMGLTAVAVQVMGGAAGRQVAGFLPLFALAVVAYTFAQQRGIRAAGFGYAFWALLIGLSIANTVGTPSWIKPALRSELYIKTGLVLLGAEILFGNILSLGVPGLFVAWVVTPTVIIFMYQFGTRILKITSRPLVIVIAAATSVCGVSAAIAAASAARAKKEELTLAVGMSLIFTVVMMVVMPLGIRGLGMDPTVGAAWIGGTVDATGAVVAAGALLGEQAEEIAAVVKMIQNTLIGVVAFLIAVYWVTRVETGQDTRRPDAMEIWRRFPKFIHRVRRGFPVLFVRSDPSPRPGPCRRNLGPHVGLQGVALLPGLRQHRPRIELPRVGTTHHRRPPDSALPDRPDVQPGPHTPGGISGLWWHPVRSRPRHGATSARAECHPPQPRHWS